MFSPLFVRVLCLSFLLCITLCPVQFCNHLEEEEKLLLSYRCLVTLNVLCLFLAVPWVGLWCVIVVFPVHTHLLFYLLFNRLPTFCGGPVFVFVLLCTTLCPV